MHCISYSRLSITEMLSRLIRRARWLSNGYGEADSRLFKLFTLFKCSHCYSQVVRIGALAHQRYLDKMLQKRKNRTSSGTSGLWAWALYLDDEARDFDSRVAFTNSASWSFAAFRYLFQPTTGREGEKRRPLDHMWQIPFVLTAQFRPHQNNHGATSTMQAVW